MDRSFPPNERLSYCLEGSGALPTQPEISACGWTGTGWSHPFIAQPWLRGATASTTSSVHDVTPSDARENVATSWRRGVRMRCRSEERRVGKECRLRWSRASDKED